MAEERKNSQSLTQEPKLLLEPPGEVKPPLPGLPGAESTVDWPSEHSSERVNELALANTLLQKEIAERKRAEEAFHAAHQRFIDIIDFLPDATFVIDEERKVIAWNRAIEEMTGVRKEDMLGRGNHTYALPFYGERRPILIDRVLEDMGLDASGYDYVRRKGVSLYAEAFVQSVYSGQGAYLWIIASPLFDQKGNRIGAIESIRDITEYKNMSEALRENAERIKQFAYSVSHDLKSPIIGINGLIRLLQHHYREFFDDKGKKYCDQVVKASEQILALIEEINIFIKTKEIPLEFELIEPREILQLVRDEFGALLSIRRISWRVSAAMPEIRADKLSLIRVIRNLVDNALKYGGEKLSEISIGYHDSEEYHVLTVSDDGVGLKSLHPEKIFGAFERDETSKGIEGTGLGLAIVREIAEKHRGRVWVEPGATAGTTFYVCIAKDL
jgi:PAS domain S-box-containing protein